MITTNNNRPFVINEFGVKIDNEEALNLMDDEIYENLSASISPCTEQEFFDAYCKAHEEKFGEPYEFAKANPVA